MEEYLSMPDHIKRTVTSAANPNIAFIKYWGNCDPEARVPANGSISMNLAGLETRTSVTFGTERDELSLNGEWQTGPALLRVSRFLDVVRQMAGLQEGAQVVSENNFPMGAGIASSASAFASLSLAASTAAGLNLTEWQLSQLARIGSGSACRSVPSGFVEWVVEGCESESAARSIAPPEHWHLADCIAVTSTGHKPISSTEGHALAFTSPLQIARVEDAPRRLDICRRAIFERDFLGLAEMIELDSNLMHAVILTSRPPVFYWLPATVAIMQAVTSWRQEGLPAGYTIDAGPNVHVICLAQDAGEITRRLEQIPGVLQVITAFPGGSAHLVE